jgi:hypothetical protein
MRTKNAFSGARLFDRLPTSASIGLSLAAVSAFATLFQGITTLLSVPGFYFNFTYGSVNSRDLNLSQKLGLIIVIWATLELVAIYLATGPRPVARFIVIALAGVKLLAFISYTPVNYSNWEQVFLVLFSAAPIILLLSRRSNEYYSVN